ncbi:MAG TPA: acetoacetate decarboxylase family protein [Sphingomicrobium sp.]|nr:acetoacetate decarboxylase family protein [Sphingomicrobium sp.]
MRPHALAPIADLPVREILSATHVLADLTLGPGKVVNDYLTPAKGARVASASGRLQSPGRTRFADWGQLS